MESLICNYLSVAAHKIVWEDPSEIHLHVAGMLSNQQTTTTPPLPPLPPPLPSAPLHHPHHPPPSITYHCKVTKCVTIYMLWCLPFPNIALTLTNRLQVYCMCMYTMTWHIQVYCMCMYTVPWRDIYKYIVCECMSCHDLTYIQVYCMCMSCHDLIQVYKYVVCIPCHDLTNASWSAHVCMSCHDVTNTSWPVRACMSCDDLTNTNWSVHVCMSCYDLTNTNWSVHVFMSSYDLTNTIWSVHVFMSCHRRVDMCNSELFLHCVFCLLHRIEKYDFHANIRDACCMLGRNGSDILLTSQRVSNGHYPVS